MNDLLISGFDPSLIHHVGFGSPFTDQIVQKLLDNDLRIFGLRFFPHDPTVIILRSFDFSSPVQLGESKWKQWSTAG